MSTPGRKQDGENRSRHDGIEYAEDISSMRILEKKLCDAAVINRYSKRSYVDVETCRGCRGCGYGKRYVQLYDRQKEKKKKEAAEMATTKKSASELTLQEQLEQERAKVQELSKTCMELGNGVEKLEKDLEQANGRLAENHVTIEFQRLNILKLKARLYDLEHPED